MNALSIEFLMVVVVQDQDLELGTHALNGLNLSFVYFASSGGCLCMRNAALLLGLRERQVGEAPGALEESCHQRLNNSPCY